LVQGVSLFFSAGRLVGETNGQQLTRRNAWLIRDKLQTPCNAGLVVSLTKEWGDKQPQSSSSLFRTAPRVVAL